MRLLAALLVVAAAAADRGGVFQLRQNLETSKKVAYLTPIAEPPTFLTEKSFDAELMQPGAPGAMRLTFIEDKLAKVITNFKGALATKEQWTLMIALRRKQHDGVAPCYASGNDCYEWADDSSAERLIYDSGAPSIQTTLIDRGLYKKAVYADPRKRKQKSSN
jgi:hypothetical protein